MIIGLVVKCYPSLLMPGFECRTYKNNLSLSMKVYILELMIIAVSFQA